MTQGELIKDFSQRTGMTYTDCEFFIDAFKDCIVEGLINDGVVRIKNLCAFKTHTRKAHVGYDIKEKGYIKKPETIMVRCEINPKLTDYIKEKLEMQMNGETIDEDK